MRCLPYLNIILPTVRNNYSRVIANVLGVYCAFYCIHLLIMFMALNSMVLDFFWHTLNPSNCNYQYCCRFHQRMFAFKNVDAFKKDIYR